MQKFFLYVRKSTDVEDKQVRSIEDQIAELRAFAKNENLEISDVLLKNNQPKFLAGQYSMTWFQKLSRAKPTEFWLGILID